MGRIVRDKSTIINHIENNKNTLSCVWRREATQGLVISSKAAHIGR
jgi:hypothetical protein